MPVLPKFIPMPKEMEMFAVSSWRDSPQVSAPHNNNNNNNNNIPPSLPSPAVLPAAQSEKENASQNNNNNKGNHRSRRGRGRAKSRLAQRQQDVDDYFVNCVLPTGVSFNLLMSELQLHSTTPLRAYDIGTPHTLFPRRNGSVGSAGVNNNNNNNNNNSALESNSADATVSSPSAAGNTPGGVINSAPTNSDITSTTAPIKKNNNNNNNKTKQMITQPSPFRTPMIAAESMHAAANNSTIGMLADDGDESPGAALPDLSLPLSIPSEILLKGHLISLLFAESSEAEKVSEIVKKKWPQSTVVIVSRNRAVLNASLVLKGLPSLSKTERIIEELEKVIPQKPSYIRLHRGERGVFKNVVFVKYTNRELAEECKLRLERFLIGSRPLKVEFKKKEKPPLTAAITNTNNTNTMENENGTTLQQLVRDLRVSTENEGFEYQRNDLTREEIKLLKQLCSSYHLNLIINEKTVTVRRILSCSGRPSPALRPHNAHSPAISSASPYNNNNNNNATAATPGAQRPLDFKGISHWKEMRAQIKSLGIIHSKGPGEVPPFAPGRGRPL